MGELASLRCTRALLREIRAFPHMLLVTVQALLAVSQNREIAAHALPRTHIHMRKGAFLARAPPLVEEMQAEGCALRGRVVREVAGIGRVRAVVLKEVPADGDLGGVVLIHACEATATST